MSEKLIFAKSLDEIHEKAEQTCLATEAHMRIMIKSLSDLNMVKEPPPWFDSEFFREQNIHAKIEKSARNLVCALIAAQEKETEALLDLSEDEGIEIAWQTDSQLTWKVSYPAMSWPGVKVRVYSRMDLDQPELQCRAFILAHSVIEYSLASLKK